MRSANFEFESIVKLEGSLTTTPSDATGTEFESIVKLEGSLTQVEPEQRIASLRVLSN